MVLIFFIFGIWQVAFIYKRKNIKNTKYNINKILQKKGKKLPSMYLAEILELSKDSKKNIFLFDIKKEEEKLEKNPFIKKAFIRKIKPSSLYIDYILREPLALIADFENVATDREGYIFFVQPFIKKKNIPKIYLGEKDLFKKKDLFEKPLKNKKLKIALDILKNVDLNIKLIDMSSAFLKSLGKREIILKIENLILASKEDKNIKFIFPIFVRLNVKDYKKCLSNFYLLNRKMIEDYKKQVKIKGSREKIKYSVKCIDMRINNLAFVDD